MIELKKEKTIKNLINRIRNHISNGVSNVLMIFDYSENKREIIKNYEDIQEDFLEINNLFLEETTKNELIERINQSIKFYIKKSKSNTSIFGIYYLMLEEVLKKIKNV